MLVAGLGGLDGTESGQRQRQAMGTGAGGSRPQDRLKGLTKIPEIVVPHSEYSYSRIYAKYTPNDMASYKN